MLTVMLNAEDSKLSHTHGSILDILYDEHGHDAGYIDSRNSIRTKRICPRQLYYPTLLLAPTDQDQIDASSQTGETSPRPCLPATGGRERGGHGHQDSHEKQQPSLSVSRRKSTFMSK